MKRLDSCEGGHVTGLVKCDKDTVIMLLCIGTSRTHLVYSYAGYIDWNLRPNQLTM